MNYPKVRTVEALDSYVLIVTFDNDQTKRYDMSPLLERDMFAPLKNFALFKTAMVEQGGYAVVWNEGIDISEHELWTHGQD